MQKKSHVNLELSTQVQDEKADRTSTGPANQDGSLRLFQQYKKKSIWYSPRGHKRFYNSQQESEFWDKRYIPGSVSEFGTN